MPSGRAGTPLAKVFTDAKVCAIAVSNYDSSVAIGTSKGGVIIVRDPGSIGRSYNKGFQHPQQTVLQRGGRCISSIIFTHHNEVVAGDIEGNLTSHCFQKHASGRRTGFHDTIPLSVSLPRSHKLLRHSEPILKLDERFGLLADCDGRHVEFWKEGRERRGTGHWECLRIMGWDDPWTQRFLDVTVGEVNVIVLTSDRILLLDPREDKFLPTMQLEVPDCSAGLRSITLSSTGILAAAADNGLIYCWELLSSSSSNSNGKQHLTITVTQQSEAELPFGISADRIQWARRCGKAPQLLAAICDDGGLLACSLEPLKGDARVCIDIRPSFIGGGSEGTVLSPPPPLVAFATGPNRLVCAQSNGPIYIYNTSETALAHSMMAREAGVSTSLFIRSNIQQSASSSVKEERKDDNNWEEDDSFIENEDWTGRLEEKRQDTSMVLGMGTLSKVKKKKFRKKEVIQEELQLMLPELQAVLRVRGSFTDNQRLVAWGVLLQLPRNTESFHALVSKGIHPAYRKLGERYPIQVCRAEQQLTQSGKRTTIPCSRLYLEVFYAHDYPFSLRTDDLGAFETVLTVLLRFGSPWLAIYPQLPLTTLTQLAGCLGRFDPKLSKHFKLCSVDVVDYGWVLLRSAFSEVLRRDDWLRLWDHLFSIASVDSDAMMWAAVAIVIAKRSELLDTTDGETIRTSFHSISNYVSVDNILQVLHRVRRKMLNAKKTLVLDCIDCDREGRAVLEAALRTVLQKQQQQHAIKSSSSSSTFPLPIGKYPEFGNEPPAFVENYQMVERNFVVAEYQKASNNDDIHARGHHQSSHSWQIDADQMRPYPKNDEQDLLGFSSEDGGEGDGRIGLGVGC